MSPAELLTALVALFNEKIPSASFFEAYRAAEAERNPAAPFVSAELLSETIKPFSNETSFLFRIYLPGSGEMSQAGEIFAEMCSAAALGYPGFSAITRAEAKTDKSTGLLYVPCTLCFLSENSAALSEGGEEIAINGEVFTAGSVSLSFTRSGKELFSVGESLPFAAADERKVYEISLKSIETAALPQAEDFTLEVAGRAFKNCRYSAVSAGKAIIRSYERE